MVKDILGNNVEVGDKIAYALMYGNSPKQCLYEVLAIESSSVCVRHIKSAWDWTQKRDSVLSMVDRRGVIIEKKKS